MNQTNTIVKMVLDRWNASLASCDNLLKQLSNEALQKEIAPGRNRGIYLLGHLVAVHDDMLILLGIGEKDYPELQEPFLKQPDKAVADLPSAATLRSYWEKQSAKLHGIFEAMQPGDWFEKHTVVSAEDFATEPHRNKLNIILTRTNHLQYHIGQLILLK
ncbi:MAG: hypothetical protein JWQ27_3326 [Ferruginibacter sp.]|nr:hypothetical protein [Ferruginibacter sp.]